MQLSVHSGVEHEFRTTRVSALLSDRDLAEIKAAIPEGSFHRLQTFRSELALD